MLSALLTFAIENGKLCINPCGAIKNIYECVRSDISWTPADLAQFLKTCSPEIGNAVELAAASGLRLGDLMKLSAVSLVMV